MPDDAFAQIDKEPDYEQLYNELLDAGYREQRVAYEKNNLIYAIGFYLLGLYCLFEAVKCYRRSYNG